MNNSSVNEDDGTMTSKLSTFERHFKFYFLLITHMPSLCLIIFILHNFKWNHLVNQILGLLVIVNGLIIIAELPFTLSYLYYGFVRHMAICSGWVIVNYTLFILSLSLTAWTSIERYLFIYHEHFIKRHVILLHYFPIGIHIVYTPLFYAVLVIFYPCEQAYTPYSYTCGGPCYLFQVVPAMIDWSVNAGLVLLVTCVANIVLIVANIHQRDRMKRAISIARNRNQWRRTIKLSVQLFSVSIICIIGWIPYAVVSTMQIFADTPLLDYMLSTFVSYFPYVQTLFLPYACLFFMPEIKQKFYQCVASFWCFKLFHRQNQVHVYNNEGSYAVNRSNLTTRH